MLAFERLLASVNTLVLLRDEKMMLQMKNSVNSRTCSHTFKWCLNLKAFPHCPHLNFLRSGPSA